MSLVVLVALGLLSLAVGLAAPMAELELRQGRSAFRSLVVDALARGGLTELERAAWTAAGASVSVGGSLALGAVAARPGLSLDRRIWRLGPSLWFGEAVADLRDAGGAVQATARQGLIIRVGAEPPDTIVVTRVTTRPWVTGFQ